MSISNQARHPVFERMTMAEFVAETGECPLLPTPMTAEEREDTERFISALCYEASARQWRAEHDARQVSALEGAEI